MNGAVIGRPIRPDLDVDMGYSETWIHMTGKCSSGNQIARTIVEDHGVDLLRNVHFGTCLEGPTTLPVEVCRLSIADAPLIPE
jgi:hypothetical protein